MSSICRECGGRFVKTVWNKKFCSKKCKQKYFNIKYGKIYHQRYENKYPGIHKKIKRRYIKTHPERRKKSLTEYNRTVKGFKTRLRYRKSPKGNLTQRKQTMKRKSRLRLLKHSFTPIEWERMKRNTKGICPSCNRYVGIDKITIDHITPISKAPLGFEYSINDIQPMCKPCNTRKFNRI